MATNPVFNRIEQDAQRGYAGFEAPRNVGTERRPNMGQAPAQWAGQDAMTQRRLENMYNQPPAGPIQTGRVTMDDVIMKTLSLFGIVLVTATIGWMVSAANPGLGFMLWMGGMIATLILGFVIVLKKTLSVPLILVYAAVQGLFVGAVSQFFAVAFDPPNTPVFQGIVAQAVLATLATFAGMFIAYKTGLIKVTAKFRRIVTMMIFGYAIFAVVNFIYAMVSNTAFGFGGSGPLGIAISLFAVGLASVSLALDFDSIERAIASGAPEKYSWLLAHGVMVTLVWLYIEFLRLLARLRSN
ncbi:MAG: Bax inhibitor-1/YccA family protein [Dermatophilaceae bacterium]|nr:Bax inhibitor-1/YccA family protein [Intrasporangiaceae bacterium]